eukprot:753873-Hanusia_phi.AAC.1
MWKRFPTTGMQTPDKLKSGLPPHKYSTISPLLRSPPPPPPPPQLANLATILVLPVLAPPSSLRVSPSGLHLSTHSRASGYRQALKKKL